MILIRYVLIGLIVYLIIRSFSRYGNETTNSGRKSEEENHDTVKKVSKKIGEYVDFEEIKDKK